MDYAGSVVLQASREHVWSFLTIHGTTSGSHFEAVSNIRLSDLGDERTRLDWEFVFSVHGRLASLANRVLDRVTAQKTLREVEANLAEGAGSVARVVEAEAEETSLARTLARREAALARAGEALKKAELAAEEARERRRRAESDEGVQRRELERQRLEKRLLELQAAEREVRSRCAAAEKAGARMKAIEDLESRIHQRETVLKTAGDTTDAEPLFEGLRDSLKAAAAKLKAAEAGKHPEMARLALWNLYRLVREGAE